MTPRHRIVIKLDVEGDVQSAFKAAEAFADPVDLQDALEEHTDGAFQILTAHAHLEASFVDDTPKVRGVRIAAVLRLALLFGAADGVAALRDPLRLLTYLGRAANGDGADLADALAALGRYAWDHDEPREAIARTIAALEQVAARGGS